MRKYNKRQILAFVLSGMLLCNTISLNSFAKEDVAENTVVEESQESQENIETQESQENQEDIVTQESQKVVSTKDDMQEEPIEEEIATEEIDNNLVISATESSAKNLEEGQNSEKTEVKDLAQESFDTFDEEVSKLISLYDRNIDGDRIASRTVSPYALRRLIVKGLGKDLDFSSYGADIVIHGPDEIYILQFSTEESTKQAKRQIDQMDGVKYCEADGYDYLEEPEVRRVSDDEIAQVAQEQNSLSWGTSHILADQYAKHLQENQAEVIVAVVDTGIDISHSFFNGRLSMDAAYNYVSANTDVQDDHGHGTHVSGIVVDTTPGVNIKILPIKCMNSSGSGTYINVANAIKRAADAGAKIINYSAVGEHSEYKDEAVNYALQKGVTVVVASGNYGQDIDTKPTCPAHMEGCIVVGSVNEREIRDNGSNYGEQLDLVAPGVGIKSAYLAGAYAFMSGTSMAAPHVSGVAAMLKLNAPSLTPFQIEEILKNNAKDLGDAGRDIYYGYGMVDLSKLIVHKIVKDEAIEPTCTEIGLTEGSHCFICNTVIKKQEIIPALGHNYESEVTKEPTEVEKGIKTYTCKRCGDTYTEEIAVLYFPVTRIALNKTSMTLSINKSEVLSAKIIPSHATNKNIIWSSSNEAIAIVSETGEVKAVGEGTATIMAKTEDSEKTATCEVTVLATIKPQIVGYTGTVTIARGDKIAVLKAPVGLDAGIVSYTNNNSSVVRLTKSGDTYYVTALKNGTATIMAKGSMTGVKTGTIKVTVVTKKRATKVAFKSNDTTLYLGQKVKTKVITSPSAASKMMKYTSSNENVATVSSNGLITGKMGGTAMITATAKDGSKKSSSVIITVTSIKLSGKSKVMTVGEEVRADDYFIFAPQTVADSVIYSSDNEDVVKVVDKKLVAVNPGRVNITVKTYNGSGLIKKYSFKVKEY